MNRVLIVLAAVLAVIGLMGIPADAKFVSGTASNTVIGVGADGGTANQVDLGGDIVASYTSGAGNDTQFKTTGGVDTVSVKPVFGDTTDMQGPASASVAPASSATYTIRVTNYANVSDVIKIDNDTPTGGAVKDSITIKVNGVVVYQGGVTDTFAPYALPSLPPGAETSVTVQITHQDTNGGLGTATVIMRAKANNGVGGEAGGYVGNNGDNYAGFGDDAETLTITVNQINVLMSIAHDPIVLPGSYSGPVGDTVPGATMTYVIRYDNDGNDTAVNFTLSAKIPANTKLAQADTSLVQGHTGSTVTVTITDDTGTVVGDTDPNAFRIKWTFNVGVGSNNGDANGVVDAAIADVDAGIVKFKVYIK